MALPMVHLLAAHSWARDNDNLIGNPEYYLGSISPDAIHIRDGNDKSRKNEIHLNNWRTPDPDAVVEYWNEHNTPFDIGYGIHVLLDGQWAVRFRARLPGVLLPNGKPNPEIYYLDTCVTDFKLKDRSDESAFLWNMVKRAAAPADHPLLSEHEIDVWRNDMIRIYDRPCPKSGEVKYITFDYVSEFLNDCNELFDETYGRLKI